MTERFIPPHGGYEQLLSFQKARIVYDGTVWFCGHYLLDQQIRHLEDAFVKEGGLRERMTRARLSERAKQNRA